MKHIVRKVNAVDFVFQNETDNKKNQLRPAVRASVVYQSWRPGRGLRAGDIWPAKKLYHDPRDRQPRRKKKPAPLE